MKSFIKLVNLMVFITLLVHLHPSNGDKASDELQDWAAANQNSRGQIATDQRGGPAPSLTASKTVGQSGNVLLEDTNLVEVLAHFNRERIVERVVHAKGSGAFGYFIVQHDITQYTKAKVFDRIGKKTPVLTRFSSSTGESGSSDLIQDGRGFATKFYTEDGNWDLVGNNIPIFQIRDAILFPMSLHTRKRNPRTHLEDPNARWDFDGQRPETVFHTIFQQSGLGRPDGWRHMDGFGVHTFKLVNRQGRKVYCKFHVKTDQGIKNLTSEEASLIAGKDLDYFTRDLYNAIANQEFPSWTLAMQVMTFEQAANYRWNPFDVTKLWREQDFPLRPIGKIVLNRNAEDFFTQIEQSAFAVGNFVPGIEAPSGDRMLHARMFSYSDAIRYRLGSNANLIEVNRPLKAVKVKSYLRDGVGCYTAKDNGKGAPNYFPNTFDQVRLDPNANETVYQVTGDVVRYDNGDEDNFSQADWYWRTQLDPAQRKIVVDNILSTLGLTYPHIQAKVVQNFLNVNAEIGGMIRDGLQKK